MNILPIVAVGALALASPLRVADPVTSAEETTWRPGDLVVVYGFCKSLQALQWAVAVRRWVPDCVVDALPAVEPRCLPMRGGGCALPIAAQLLEWHGPVLDGRSAWAVDVDGGRSGFVSLPDVGGTHAALEAL